jgi:hypothetical protein
MKEVLSNLGNMLYITDDNAIYCFLFLIYIQFNMQSFRSMKQEYFKKVVSGRDAGKLGTVVQDTINQVLEN